MYTDRGFCTVVSLGRRETASVSTTVPLERPFLRSYTAYADDVVAEICLKTSSRGEEGARLCVFDVPLCPHLVLQIPALSPQPTQQLMLNKEV